MVKNTMYGHAAREIVADAIEIDCGIIVMGSRGRGDLAGLVVGSTAHKVIHLADRPVLIVRWPVSLMRSWPTTAVSGVPLDGDDAVLDGDDECGRVAETCRG